MASVCSIHSCLISLPQGEGDRRLLISQQFCKICIEVTSPKYIVNLLFLSVTVKCSPSLAALETGFFTQNPNLPCKNLS